MKNSTLVLLSLVVGLLSGCSASQGASAAGTNPPPTVTVPPAQTSEPVAEKPKDQSPADTQKPPPEEAQPVGRLALQQCSEESRKVKNCATIAQPVCAEVDTGLRCIRAPCPGSTAQQTYDNACTACLNTKVRGYWATSCEKMTQPAPQPSNPTQ